MTEFARNRQTATVRFRIALTVVFAVSTLAAADDSPWPRFRGPNGDGVAADDPRLPDSWSTTENVAWIADVPGQR